MCRELKLEILKYLFQTNPLVLFKKNKKLFRSKTKKDHFHALIEGASLRGFVKSCLYAKPQPGSSLVSIECV